MLQYLYRECPYCVLCYHYWWCYSTCTGSVRTVCCVITTGDDTVLVQGVSILCVVLSLLMMIQYLYGGCPYCVLCCHYLWRYSTYTGGVHTVCCVITTGDNTVLVQGVSILCVVLSLLVMIQYLYRGCPYCMWCYYYWWWYSTCTGGVHTVCCVITTGDNTVLVQGVSILCVVLSLLVMIQYFHRRCPYCVLCYHYWWWYSTCTGGVHTVCGVITTGDDTVLVQGVSILYVVLSLLVMIQYLYRGCPYCVLCYHYWWWYSTCTGGVHTVCCVITTGDDTALVRGVFILCVVLSLLVTIQYLYRRCPYCVWCYHYWWWYSTCTGGVHTVWCVITTCDDTVLVQEVSILCVVLSLLVMIQYLYRRCPYCVLCYHYWWWYSTCTGGVHTVCCVITTGDDTVLVQEVSILCVVLSLLVMIQYLYRRCPYCVLCYHYWWRYSTCTVSVHTGCGVITTCDDTVLVQGVSILCVVLSLLVTIQYLYRGCPYCVLCYHYWWWYSTCTGGVHTVCGVITTGFDTVLVQGVSILCVVLSLLVMIQYLYRGCPYCVWCYHYWWWYGTCLWGIHTVCGVITTGDDTVLVQGVSVLCVVLSLLVMIQYLYRGCLYCVLCYHYWWWYSTCTGGVHTVCGVITTGDDTVLVQGMSILYVVLSLLVMKQYLYRGCPYWVWCYHYWWWYGTCTGGVRTVCVVISLLVMIQYLYRGCPYCVWCYHYWWWYSTCTGGVHTVCCVITTGDDTVLVQGVSILCVVLSLLVMIQYLYRRCPYCMWCYHYWWWYSTCTGGVHTMCCVITTGDDTVLVQGVSILCVVLSLLVMIQYLYGGCPYCVLCYHYWWWYSTCTGSVHTVCGVITTSDDTVLVQGVSILCVVLSLLVIIQNLPGGEGGKGFVPCVVLSLVMTQCLCRLFITLPCTFFHCSFFKCVYFSSLYIYNSWKVWCRRNNNVRKTNFNPSTPSCCLSTRAGFWVVRSPKYSHCTLLSSTSK